MPRNLLPFVLLAVAVVVALSVLRGPASPVGAPVASSLPPSTSGPSPVASPGPMTGPPPGGAAPSGRVYNDPPMTQDEARDWHLKVGHESCEEGAKRINELQGLNPTDPQGIKFIGACLRNGNVAWYKCLLKANTRLEAGTCNRRFLANAPPP